jgi:hypothetical protein
MKCGLENGEEPNLAKHSGQAKVIAERTFHHGLLKCVIGAIFAQYGER